MYVAIILATVRVAVLYNSHMLAKILHFKVVYAFF